MAVGTLRRLPTVLLSMALGLVMMLGLALSAQAAVDLHRFDDPILQTRYDRLTDTLRCPKCENQAIGDSNSPIAGDMRNYVARALKNGESDDAIRQAMVSRFGDYVLYRPRLEWRTVALWAGPGLVVLLGIVAIGTLIRSRRRARPEALDAAERQRLDALLARHHACPDQDVRPDQDRSHP